VTATGGARSRIGRPLVRLTETGSTNDVARQLAEGGVREGAVVVAACQTRGRGRLGRAWESPQGGLWCTVLLRPMGGSPPGLLSLAVGLAVAETVEVAGVEAALRWPNDVLIGERKVAGALLEAAGAAVVAGIGINVNVQLEALPPDVAGHATSLHLHAARPLDVEQVLWDLVDRLDTWYRRWTDTPGTVVSTWPARDALRGRPVRVAGGAVPVEGVADGVAPDGALRVRQANGRVHTVVAGDVLPGVGWPAPCAGRKGLQGVQGPAIVDRPKHVVSVSLGSSRRDKRVETTLLGQRFVIERIGTDGDYALFCRRLRELDGTVDAIGLGGINLALAAGRRRYAIRDAVRAVRGLRTPVVDGSGIKRSWERHVLLSVLPQAAGWALAGRRVLLVSSVDRFGMAEALVTAGADVVFGDLMFGLGIPIRLRGLATVKVLAALLLPVLTRLPFTWLYPTGEHQDEIVPKFGGVYRWADVICGDFHLIRRHMPDDLSGKVIFTNTLTTDDMDALRRRRAALVVTSTPEMEGRSFATNVIEAVILVLSGRRPGELDADDYLEWMRRAGFQARVDRVAAPAPHAGEAGRVVAT
jgi:biotin-[acetyl-CoA-carboxylase] ligase BirA-like protein